MNENHSIGDVARLSGVTVRTLHHYDSIGLLVPSGRTSAGYREYSAQDIERLQQIVAYRACGLSLTDVAELLKTSGRARAEHLSRQVAMLDVRLADMTRQRATLGKELEAQRMGISLNPQEYFEVFGAEDPRQYAQEVEQRWGETDAYAESARRTADYTKNDWILAKAEQEAVVEEFRVCCEAGLPADSERAMAAAEAHRARITARYYDCSHEFQVGLADMFIADPRFAAYYDDRLPGLAQYVHTAIYANALRQ